MEHTHSCCCYFLRLRSERNPTWVVLYWFLSFSFPLSGFTMLLCVLTGAADQSLLPWAIALSCIALIMHILTVFPCVKYLLFICDQKEIEWSYHETRIFINLIYSLACIALIAANRTNFGVSGPWVVPYNPTMITNIAICWAILTITDTIILFAAFGTREIGFLYVIFCHSVAMSLTAAGLFYVDPIIDISMMAFHTLIMFVTFCILTWKMIPWKCDKSIVPYGIFCCIWQVIGFGLFTMVLSNGNIIDTTNYQNTICNFIFLIQPLPTAFVTLYYTVVALKYLVLCMPACVGWCVGTGATYVDNMTHDIEAARKATNHEKSYQNI